MARDGVGEEEVLKRIKAQMRDEQKLPLADHVIINDGELSVLEQVWNYHQMFMREKG
jgi:dephospho-CoA kinase